MARNPCCGREHTNKGAWTKEEDLILKTYVESHRGECSWRALPTKAGLNRCGKSCRLRWVNYLNPNIKRGHFTDEEDELLIKLHSEHGNKWSVIAKELPGRTDNDIKNHFNTNLRRELYVRGISPVTHKPIIGLAEEVAAAKSSKAKAAVIAKAAGSEPPPPAAKTAVATVPAVDPRGKNKVIIDAADNESSGSSNSVVTNRGSGGINHGAADSSTPNSGGNNKNFRSEVHAFLANSKVGGTAGSSALNSGGGGGNNKDIRPKVFDFFSNSKVVGTANSPTLNRGGGGGAVSAHHHHPGINLELSLAPPAVEVPILPPPMNPPPQNAMPPQQAAFKPWNGNFGGGRQGMIMGHGLGFQRDPAASLFKVVGSGAAANPRPTLENGGLMRFTGL